LGVLQSAAVILALNLLVQVGGRSQTVRLSDARTCTRVWLAFGPLGIRIGSRDYNDWRTPQRTPPS